MEEKFEDTCDCERSIAAVFYKILEDAAWKLGMSGMVKFWKL